MATKTKKVTIEPQKKGQEAVSFTKGGLHKSLDVPQGEKIPAAKLAAAKAGAYGPKAEKQAHFAAGMLKTGRKTAAKHRAKEKK